MDVSHQLNKPHGTVSWVDVMNLKLMSYLTLQTVLKTWEHSATMEVHLLLR